MRKTIAIHKGFQNGCGTVAGQIRIHQGLHLSQVDPRRTPGGPAAEHIRGQTGQCFRKIRLGGCHALLDNTAEITHIVPQQGHDGLHTDVHAEGIGQHGFIHGDHILKIQGILPGIFTEGLACKHIDLWIPALGSNDFRLRGNGHHVFRKACGVGNAHGQCRRGNTLLGAYNAHHLQLHTRSYSVTHIVIVCGHILPDIIFRIILVQGGCGNQAEPQAHQLIIGPFLALIEGLRIHDFSPHDLGHQFHQRFRILQAQGIGHKVRDLAGITEHDDQLIVAFRPAALQHIILGGQHFGVIDHLMEHIGVHVGRHGGGTHHIRKQRTGVYLKNAFRGILRVNQGLHSIIVVHVIDGMADRVEIGLQICLKGSQVIGAHLGKHLGQHGLLHHDPLLCLFRLRHGRAIGRKHGGHIGGFLHDGQRIIGQGIRLDLVDI